MACQRPPWVGPNSLIPDAEEPPRPPTPPGYIPPAPTPPPPPSNSVQAVVESESESEVEKPKESKKAKKPKKSKKARRAAANHDQAVAPPAPPTTTIVPPPPPAGSVRSDGAQVQNSRYTQSSEMRDGGVQHKQAYYYTISGENGHNSGSLSWFEANQSRQ